MAEGKRFEIIVLVEVCFATSSNSTIVYHESNCSMCLLELVNDYIFIWLHESELGMKIFNIPGSQPTNNSDLLSFGIKKEKQWVLGIFQFFLQGI
jgi:hypothetical protein